MKKTMRSSRTFVNTRGVPRPANIEDLFLMAGDYVQKKAQMRDLKSKIQVWD